VGAGRRRSGTEAEAGVEAEGKGSFWKALEGKEVIQEKRKAKRK